MIDEKTLLRELCELGKKMQQQIKMAERDKKEEMFEFAIKNQIAMLHNVIQKIKEQPKIREWIPCSERLPDDPEGGIPRDKDELDDAYVKDKIKKYIVMIDGATEPTALFYVGEGRWYDCDGDLGWFPVVAWQPLPEPFMKKKDNDEIG